MQHTIFCRRAVLVLAGSLTFSSTALAVTAYTARPTYTAAAGPATASENFSGFTADTSFATTAVAVNGYSLQQFGTSGFRNLIEATPFVFTDNNGTSHASCATNINDAGTAEFGVLITFPSPVTAFGGDFYGVEGVLAGSPGAEGLRALVFNGGTQIASFNLVDQISTGVQFLGVVAGSGEQITSIRLASRTAVATNGEGFGLDDTVVTVPEPATAALLLLPVAALARRRIPRQRAAR